MGGGAEYRYDLGGRRTEINTRGNASQKYEYDAWGNITGVTDGAGNTTEYEYNGAGQMSALTDPEGEKERYAYDAEGRLCRKTDRNGVETLYTYNMYGNPLLRKAGDLSERYEYTPEGLLKSAISQGMRYGYAYDVMGRLKEKTASGRTLLSLEYDRNGNLSRQTDVTGKITEYRYDLMDQMESVRDTGRCVARYEYNPDGTICRLINGDSLYTEYSYDLDKNLTGLKTMLGEEVLADNHYRHDGNGNTVEKRQPGGLTSYAYDQMNRLSLVQYPDRKEELFYDKAGNRSRRILGGMEERYEYDRRNRLVTYRKGGDASRFEYDHAGNLTKDNQARYEYDSFNRTAKVETFGGNIQVNRYDPEGLRHEMEENGRLVSFIFRDREVVAEETIEDTVRYIRGTELLSSDAVKARTYYHYASDELGSITHVTDGSQVLNRYEYDAWGNVTASEERVENRFKFNGQQYDPISQQYYLRARYYNPVIGRFIQEDTYRGDGLNLYAYCANNPICFVDPSGNTIACQHDAERIMALMKERKAGREDVKNLSKYLRDKKNNGGIFSSEEMSMARDLGIDVKGDNRVKGNRYATAIDDKVTVINKNNLPESLGNTFTDGEYRTVVTNGEVKVYRTFGGKADAGGGFATTTSSNSRIESKIDSALLPEWGNTRAYEAEITIPKNQELAIGKVALQTIKGSGTVLQGGADQILLPQNWPLEWITKIRNVSF